MPLGIVFDNLGHDLAPDSGVLVDQVQTGFAGLLTRPCGEDGDGGSGAVRKITRPHSRGMSERHGVIEVHGLAFRLGAVGVYQHDFGSQSAEEEGVGKSRADISYADYGHSHGTAMLCVT
jgi:hypothetical protein